MARLYDYLSLAQPRIVALLVLSALAGFGRARSSWNGFVLLPLVSVLVAVLASSMGAELLNKMLEVDIDGKMRRTASRASVSGAVSPLTGTAWGVTLVSLGIVAGGLANWLTSLMIALGAVFYVLVYTAVFKRRSRFAVLIGGFAGSFCVWAGVAAAAGTITIPGIILGMLVLLWIPGHIWSLALRFRKEYRRAGVPMFSAVETPRKGTMAIVFFNILMSLVSLSLALFLGAYYLAMILIPLLLILYLSYRVAANQSVAWPLFKFSSPYLAFVFFAVILTRLL